MKVYVVVEIIFDNHSPYTPKIFGVFDNKKDAQFYSHNCTKNVWCEVVEKELTTGKEM